MAQSIFVCMNSAGTVCRFILLFSMLFLSMFKYFCLVWFRRVSTKGENTTSRAGPSEPGAIQRHVEVRHKSSGAALQGPGLGGVGEAFG